jgi:hypothetical protein
MLQLMGSINHKANQTHSAAIPFKAGISQLQSNLQLIDARIIIPLNGVGVK